MYKLVFDAGPWEWALAAVFAAAFLSLWPGLRRLPPVLRALRVAAALLLLASVLKPTLERMRARLARARLSILLDTGPSMSSSDDLGKPRLKRAVAWLKTNRERLEQRADVSLFSSSEGSRRLAWTDLDSLKPAAAALDPSSAFAALADAGPPASRVWLLSDGAFGRGESAGEAAPRLGAPMDTLGVGPRKARRGVAVADIQSPDFVFLHSRFSVSATLEANELAGGAVSARLWKGGRKIAELEFPVQRSFDIFSATFTIPADGLGRQAYRIEAWGKPASGARVSIARGTRAEPEGAAADKEVRSAAAREFRVEVIRQKYRIMYLAGRPSFEYAHLRAQLKDDPNYELVSFVILRNPENVSPVPDNELSLIPFPAAEIFTQSLPQFDLFILENFAYWRFNLPSVYLQNLRNFVSQGGALLVIGGSNAFTKGGYQGTALEDALPVTLWPQADDFSPGLFSPEIISPEHPLLNLGDSPEASLELWKALPPLDGYNRFASVKPGAMVLLRHPTEKTASGQGLPIVATREFGRGKVMVMGTDSTWRWKLGGGNDWRLSSFYARFWSRSVQYLTGSLDLKKVKFSPLPDRMPAREPAILNLRVFDEHFRPVSGSDVDLRIAWILPDGSERRVTAFEREPGVFQMELTGLAEGRHRVRALARYRGQVWGEDSVEFHWEMPKGEAPLDRKGLRDLAERTGGRYMDLSSAAADALLETLPPVRRERAVFSEEHIWSSAGWFWTLCVVLVLEWILRRRLGYI